MGVEIFLSAGTGHITYEDNLKLLNDPESFPTRVIPHEFGWWVNVLLEMFDYGYSDSFVNLMRMAHKHNCWWINLDCDGENVAGLEINDW